MEDVDDAVVDEGSSGMPLVCGESEGAVVEIERFDGRIGVVTKLRPPEERETDTFGREPARRFRELRAERTGIITGSIAEEEEEEEDEGVEASE